MNDSLKSGMARADRLVRILRWKAKRERCAKMKLVLNKAADHIEGAELFYRTLRIVPKEALRGCCHPGDFV